MIFERKRFLRPSAAAALFLGVAVAALSLSGCSSARLKETDRTFQTVVIDAGHGGKDSGAVRNGVVEKNVALDVGKRVEKRLRGEGFHTVMTRDRDVFIPLNRRAQISNAQSNAIFVSVHFNSSRRGGYRGVETYYCSNHSRALANAIQAELSRVASPSRGVKHARFRVLRLNHYPSALVECGFVTDGGEAKRISSARHRERIALAIATAIVRHRYPRGSPKERPRGGSARL